MIRQRRGLHEYYNMGTKKFDFFFQKVRNWIWLVLKSWNHSSRSQHAPICRHREMHRCPFEGRHLVLSFELKFFVCRHVPMWGFQNRVCLSVCPHPEKRNHHSFVNISPTLVIDASMERSSRVLQHGNPKIWILFQKSLKFEIWLLMKSWNHLSFVDISPTLVIDTSMERSSRVLHHWNPKIWFFFIKVRNSNFDFWRRAEITLASSISVLH